MKHLERMAWSHRPHFVPRQMLTAEQLNSGLDDEMMRQQLLNRAIHGYGVVVGYGPAVRDDGTLDLHRGCLELTGGLALDRHGRMLYWRGGRIGMDHLVGPRPDHEGHYTLSAHFACRPPLTDACHPIAGDDSQWSREGVVFTLRAGCSDIDRCCPEHPIGSCVGHDEYLCRRTGGLPGNDAGTVRVSDDVQWLLRKPGQLCPTDVGMWMYDPDPEVAVPIACLEICDLANPRPGEHEHEHEAEGEEGQETGPECEPRYGFCPARPRACRVRPLVYRNPLLYELSNCCDVELPRIRSISWQDWIDRGWSTPVEWDDFRERITRGLEIRFSRPIQVGTLHEASIHLAAVIKNRDADYWISRRVPTVRRSGRTYIEPIDRYGDVAWGVRLRPTPDWLRSEVTGDDSNLFYGAHFELTIRGQILRDECGQVLDARPVAAHGRARCETRPGGDFVSVFRVAPRPARDRSTDGEGDGEGDGDGEGESQE